MNPGITTTIFFVSICCWGFATTKSVAQHTGIRIEGHSLISLHKDILSVAPPPLRSDILPLTDKRQILIRRKQSSQGFRRTYFGASQKGNPRYLTRIRWIGEQHGISLKETQLPGWNPVPFPLMDTPTPPPLSSLRQSINTAPKIYAYHHLGIFCKLEVQLERAANLPIKIRLGEVDYVDWLEGKGDGLDPAHLRL